MKLIPQKKSFGFAWTGLKLIFETQVNARFHLVAATAVLIMAGVLGCSYVEWALLILTIGFVLTLEGVNTALEFLTDLTSPDFHPLAGKVKDVAAGAVLIGAITAFGVGIVIFIPKMLALFGT